MSYQPEERYWTDYLRIALPVVGLLLMLGLFWFWAASLIGDDDNNNTPEATVLAANQPTAVPTTPAVSGDQPTQTSDGQASGANPTTPAENPTESTSNDGNGQTDNNSGNDNQNADEDTPPATEESSDNGGNADECTADFCPDELVTTNDEVRIRSSPDSTVDDNILDTLAVGTELTVLEEPKEGDDGNSWVHVETDGGQDGYVAAQYLEKS